VTWNSHRKCKADYAAINVELSVSGSKLPERVSRLLFASGSLSSRRFP